MSNEIQFILYQLPDDEGKVQVVIKDETIWATQKAMAQLFGVDKSGVSRHIANIYKDGELQQETTVAKIATVVNRGIRGEVEEQIDFYNLDMIIAVGYRVSSARATKFRQWATKILNVHLTMTVSHQLPVSSIRWYRIGSTMPSQDNKQVRGLFDDK